MASVGGEMQAVVARLIDQARDRVDPADDGELARRIEPLVGRRYGRGAVGGWARGEINVPAFVLLAACKVAGISIDEVIFGDSLEARLRALQAKQDGFERQLNELQAKRSV